MFKRKNKNNSKGIEYILCTNDRPTLMSSSLEGLASYVKVLSKNKKMGIEYLVPPKLNSNYEYSNLNPNEKDVINKYNSTRKRYNFDFNEV